MMRRLLSFVTALVVLVSTVAALPPAAAREADIGAIYQRVQELYAAGNYPAALAEAQRLEAAVKAVFGTNHANYAAALDAIANVYRAQGKYAEAEGLYKRALA